MLHATGAVICLVCYGLVGPPPAPVLVEGKPLSYWLAAVRKEHGKKLDSAIWAVGEFGPRGAVAIPDLVKALADAGSNRKAMILRSFTRMGAAAKPAVPALVRLISSGDVVGAEHALLVLGGMGEVAGGALPALLKSYGDNRHSSLFHRELPLTLARVAPRDKQALALLRRALDDEDVGVRVNAARALWRLGDAKTDYAVAIRQGAQDDGSDVRLLVLEHLNEKATRNKGEAGALLPFLSDRDEAVRNRTISYLTKLRPTTSEAMRAYARALRDSDWFMRAVAAARLGEFERRAKPFVPALHAALRDQHPFVRSDAAHALWRIDGRYAPLAITTLRSALGAESPYARANAANRLASMGAAARPALADLWQRLSDPWSNVRLAAAAAITAILVPRIPATGA